jgi:8-hydroxy-5-deazaflavin:NADPH oxidoreductase
MAVGVTDSAGEINQHLLPGAIVVKAFNIVGNPHMVHPDFPGGPPTMFICGNDEQAKKMAS